MEFLSFCHFAFKRNATCVSQAAKGPCGMSVQITKGFLWVRGVGVALKSYVTAQSELSPPGLRKVTAQMGIPFNLIWGPVTATQHGTGRVTVTCGLQPEGILGAVPEAKLSLPSVAASRRPQRDLGKAVGGQTHDLRAPPQPNVDETSHLSVHLGACAPVRVCTHTSPFVFVHGQNAHVVPTPSTPLGAWTPQHGPGAYDTNDTSSAVAPHPGHSPGATPHPGHNPGSPPSPAATQAPRSCILRPRSSLRRDDVPGPKLLHHQ